MLKQITILCTVILISENLLATEEIFNYTEGKLSVNQTLPENKRGYTIDYASDGLIVTWHPYQTGNASWPYVATDSRAIRNNNWKGYKAVSILLKNQKSQKTTPIRFEIRDNKNKIYTSIFSLPENTETKKTVPISEIAGKIDIEKIQSVAIAFDRPNKEIILKLKNIELEKAIKRNTEQSISKIYDLRQQILDGKKGVATTGKEKIIITPEREILISAEQYHPKDKGISLFFNGESLNSGDLSTKTHITYEIEHVSGLGHRLGMSVQDNRGKSHWQGMGAAAPGLPVRYTYQIFDMGIALDDLKQLTIMCCGTPANAHTYRLKKLQFEFLPEKLYAKLEEKQKTLSRKNLNAKERSELNTIFERYTEAYNKVNGKQAKYGAIRHFLDLTQTTRRELLALLRSHTLRKTWEETPEHSYGIGIADSMTSVFLRGPGFEMIPAKKVILEMAGNETESFQTVICSRNKTLKGVRITVDNLRGPKNAFIKASASVVGHALTKTVTYPTEYTGFYPDFIIDYQKSADIAPYETVPFWIRLKTEKNTPPGTYHGTVNVTGNDIPPYSFPVQVRVYPFSLPDGAPIPQANNFNHYNYIAFYKVTDEIEKQKMREHLANTAADYRITYDRMYLGPNTNPTHKCDFPIYKKQNEQGILKNMTIVYSILKDKWNIDPHSPDVDKLINELDKHMAYWTKIAKDYGVLEKAHIYGFDEGRLDAVIERVFRYLKENYPDIPIYTTARFGDPDTPAVKYLDIWCPILPKYINRPELIQALRKKGKKVWWYVCNYPRPPEPTFLLEVPAAVPRLIMGMMSIKYRPDGFLYWSIIAWRNKTHKIMEYGPRTEWDAATCWNVDNGDGNLFVPGINHTLLPTIRVENYRDGIEDFWYYILLEQYLKQAKKQNVSPVLLQKAEQALTIPESIIKGSTQYTTDPEKIRAERRKVANAIIMLQKAGISL